MDKNTGGPAFPGEVVVHPIGAVGNHVEIMGHAEGMSLRDYFAAHAPITMNDALAWWHRQNGGAPTMVQLCAAISAMRGQYADAMILEREPAKKVGDGPA